MRPNSALSELHVVFILPSQARAVYYVLTEQKPRVSNLNSSRDHPSSSDFFLYTEANSKFEILKYDQYKHKNIKIYYAYSFTKLTTYI